MVALIHWFVAYHLYIGPTFNLAHTHNLTPQEMTRLSASPGHAPVGVFITWRIRFD